VHLYNFQFDARGGPVCFCQTQRGGIQYSQIKGTVSAGFNFDFFA